MPVFWIERVTNDVVHRLAAHQRMRYARLAIQDCARITQHLDHLALDYFLFPRPFLSFKSSDPANVAHGRLNALDVELVLEGNGDAVEGSNGFLVLSVVRIEGLGIFKSSIKEDFMQTL